MSLLVEHEGLGESTLEESFLGNAAIEVRRAVTTMVAGTSRMPNYRLTINRHGCVLLWGIPEAMGRGQDIGVSVVQIPHWDVRAPDKQTTPLMRYVLPEESLYY